MVGGFSHLPNLFPMFIKDFERPSDFGFRVVSIDPGLSTGFVVTTFYTSYYEINLSVVSSAEKLNHFLDLIFNRIYEDIVFVLVERLPEIKENKLQSIEFEILDFLRKRNKSFIRISPSEWKPIAKARKWKCNLAKSLHESDSFNMIRYYILKYYEKDIGDWS